MLGWVSPRRCPQGQVHPLRGSDFSFCFSFLRMESLTSGLTPFLPDGVQALGRAAGHGISPLDLHAGLLSPAYGGRDGDTELLLTDGPRHPVPGGEAGLGALGCRIPPPTGDRGWGRDQAGLRHASTPCQGHTRTLCGWRRRLAPCLLCAVQGQRSRTDRTGENGHCSLCRPGPGAAVGRGNGEGPQWEGEKAGGLFLEGSQSAEESQERSAPHSGSNLQLGSRLQLAGMRRAGAWDLLSPAEMVRSGGQGLIPVPCVQIPAAGAEAFPAGHSSLSFSVWRFRA